MVFPHFTASALNCAGGISSGVRPQWRPAMPVQIATKARFQPSCARWFRVPLGLSGTYLGTDSSTALRVEHDHRSSGFR